MTHRKLTAAAALALAIGVAPLFAATSDTGYGTSNTSAGRTGTDANGSPAAAPGTGMDATRNAPAVQSNNTQQGLNPDMGSASSPGSSTQGTQTGQAPAATGAPAQAAASSSNANGSITARLVNEQHNAAEKAATVQVKVAGVKITDPASADEKPKAGQAHLHYQLDNGPVIATTSTKLSFHELSSGQHKIVVMLAGNDHKPLGPQDTVTVNIQ